MRSFRLGGIVEDIISLLVSIDVVWRFDHLVEGGNQLESDLDSPLVNCLCFWLDLATADVNSEEILSVNTRDYLSYLCWSINYIASQERMHGHEVKQGTVPKTITKLCMNHGERSGKMLKIWGHSMKPIFAITFSSNSLSPLIPSSSRIQVTRKWRWAKHLIKIWVHMNIWIPSSNPVCFVPVLLACGKKFLPLSLGIVPIRDNPSVLSMFVIQLSVKLP